MGNLGIWVFALNENFKECGVAVMCQCLRKYLVKMCLSLKMGSEQISYSSESLDAQQKTMIATERKIQFPRTLQFDVVATTLFRLVLWMFLSCNKHVDRS